MDSELFTIYYMLLFPTYYDGEGFPATLCEAYMSALPVMASDWMYNNELVEDGITGYLFPVHDVGRLAELIDFAVNHPEIIYHMRAAALQKSGQYRPEYVTGNMIQWIRDIRDM